MSYFKKNVILSQNYIVCLYMLLPTIAEVMIQLNFFNEIDACPRFTCSIVYKPFINTLFVLFWVIFWKDILFNIKV